MKRLVIFISILFVGISIFAQTPPVVEVISPKKGLSKDSLKSKNVAPKRMHKKMIMALDTLTLSDYTLSIERVNDNLNTIGDSAKLGYEVGIISHRIDYLTNYVKQIRKSVRGRRTRVQIKNQYLYQYFTTKMDDETDMLQNRLDILYRRVYHAKLHLKKVLSDSIFRKLYADKELRTTFDDKLIRLEWKWNRTDSVTKANVDTLNAMKVRLSDSGLELANMLSMMDKRLERTVPKLFGQEVNNLWEKEVPETKTKDDSQSSISRVANEFNAISFYISQTSSDRLIVLVLGVLLLVWLFFKRKLIKTLRTQKESFSYLNLKYLNNRPVFSMLLILLSLMPFFNAYAPTSYIAIEFVLLLLTATILLFKNSKPAFRLNWIALVSLFIAYAVAYLLMEVSLTQRLLLLGLAAGILVFMIRFYGSLQKQIPYYSLIKPAALLGIILTILGVILNIIGRFSLSGIAGFTGIIGLTQAISLTIFVDLVFEIILLQLLSSRLKKGIDKPFESDIVISKIKMPLIIIAVFVWLIMFCTNLDIYHNISADVVDALTVTRTIGSISFQLLSVILFFVIIWVAHILQRLLSYLFGEIGTEVDEMSTETKGQHSRLLITRLLVLIGGYLLAIAASGLPIDKLTFLLGALGVGIGMGLQNIVNNFVSGIILIFDGSLKIGDEIEISGQAGKIKEIGLRASTLNTADGAEVIIPNGNILSQNIINWAEKRVMMTFSLTGNELDANVINDIINVTIEKIPHVIAHRKPVILYTKVTPASCTLTIRFWSTVSKSDLVKSDALLQLSSAFASQNIGFE